MLASKSALSFSSAQPTQGMRSHSLQVNDRAPSQTKEGRRLLFRASATGLLVPPLRAVLAFLWACPFTSTAPACHILLVIEIILAAMLCIFPLRLPFATIRAADFLAGDVSSTTQASVKYKWHWSAKLTNRSHGYPLCASGLQVASAGCAKRKQCAGVPDPPAC